MKQYMVAEGAGHYGIFSGRRWREIICPKIRAFVREHA
jgi:poly(3-hydroxybutyrate) depolymerase